MHLFIVIYSLRGIKPLSFSDLLVFLVKFLFYVVFCYTVVERKLAEEESN